MAKKVLVYGGTGSQGGAVVTNLLRNGHHPYVLTRHPEKVASMEGVQATVGDLADPDSLIAASTGMDAVSLMIPAFLDDPTQSEAFMQNAINAAKTAGVGLIVHNTSGPVVDKILNNPMYDVRLSVIKLLETSGVPYIVIQPTVYMENLMGPWTRPSVAQHDVLPYPSPADARMGWIASDDLGKLVVAAIEHPELANTRFVVSGADNLTGPELAAQFSKGLGREITYYEQPLEEFGAAIDAAFGPGAGEGAMAGYRFQREHALKLTMWTDMESVLEKLPVQLTSVEEWVQQHAAAFQPETTEDSN